MTEIIRHLWNISWTIGMLLNYSITEQCASRGVRLARVDRTLFPRNLQSILNSSTHINKIWAERVLAARQRNAIIQRKVNQLS